jgi:hypothetical protein
MLLPSGCKVELSDLLVVHNDAKKGINVGIDPVKAAKEEITKYCTVP